MKLLQPQQLVLGSAVDAKLRSTCRLGFDVT